jgi:hypothetical protein
VNQGYKLAEDEKIMDIRIDPNKINSAIDTKLDAYKKRLFTRKKTLLKKRNG